MKQVTRAFVLGGGGMLGASEVGMLRALLEADLVPDLVLGCSVGAINGAAVAAAPEEETVWRLAEMWKALGKGEVFSGSLVGRVSTLARTGTHLHGNAGLRDLLTGHAGGALIEDLPVRFECVAACIEDAAAHWFTTGPLVEAVLASCAVPGLLPAVRIGDRHYLDGGLVHSIPLGRAVALGAREVYVLHVGRIERPLAAPRRPWEVATVAFEVARRHRFTEDLAAVPDGVVVHVLPTGEENTPLATVRYRDASAVPARIERAYLASSAYLAAR